MVRLTFRLLGGLEVVNEDGVVAVGAAKQRTLLTILLLQANRVVVTNLLIDQLWRGQAPASAATTLHGYVSGLRKTLRAAGAGDLLQRRSPGYVLELQPGQIDIEEFDRLAGQGRDVVECRRLGNGLASVRRCVGAVARRCRLPLSRQQRHRGQAQRAIPRAHATGTRDSTWAGSDY